MRAAASIFRFDTWGSATWPRLGAQTVGRKSDKATLLQSRHRSYFPTGELGVGEWNQRGAVMTQLHQLAEATGESCGPVAVCSVTGASAEDVEKAIRQAAAEDNQYPADLSDTSFLHQTRAVEMLGFELFDCNSGARVEARSISVELCEHWLLQPTPAEFFEANQSDDVLLCLAHVRPGGPNPQVHTFAVHRRCYYDNNPGGIRGSVPIYFVDFRMACALAVRRRTSL